MKKLSQSEAHTRAIARDLAKAISGGVIELIGDVGAGKTTFAKGLAEGLGISGPITSPTFTISQTYQNPHGPDLYHYDFYRLEDPGLMRYELAGSVADESALTVVEWAQSVEDILPKSRITVRLTATSETERRIEIKGITL